MAREITQKEGLAWRRKHIWHRWLSSRPARQQQTEMMPEDSVEKTTIIRELITDITKYFPALCCSTRASSNKVPLFTKYLLISFYLVILIRSFEFSRRYLSTSPGNSRRMNFSSMTIHLLPLHISYELILLQVKESHDFRLNQHHLKILWSPLASSSMAKQRR